MENNFSTVSEGLNNEQRKAVECTEGPVLIVAGAGSGKTRVLTGRIAWILEKGVDPSRVMALTFTKKAASEMKERISLMVGGRKARRIVMGTFHSIFIRFLRDYAEKLGYPPQFTIYDSGDSLSAIKACLKELKLDDKVYKPKTIQTRISLAKNNLVTAEAYRNNPKLVESDRKTRMPNTCDVYSLYARKCRAAGVMDFDDILLNMNILLRDFPEAKEEIASRFDYLMVDEYQDTNFAQYLILKKLGERHRNICVVGDDSQSIYSFRGAKIENILNFKKDYPDCKLFRLETNYRSTGNIVNAANSLIAKNTNRIPKTCVSAGEEGDRLLLLKSFNEQEEGRRVVSEIMRRIQTDHAKYEDFALLYRTNSQSNALEEALRRNNLPYMVYSGRSFFERAEVKDMMAYLKLVVNVNDDESFKRAVNTPSRGIGETSMAALGSMANVLGLSLFKAAYSEKFAEFGLKAASVARIRGFCEMISGLASRVETEDADTLALSISEESRLYSTLKSDSSIESQSKASNVEELVNSVTRFVEERKSEYEAEAGQDEAGSGVPVVTLGEFLENVSLISNSDITDDEDSSNRIALMTIHSSKGLEFPYVFVTGMEENLFPNLSMLSTSNEVEEERRLFYVAMTRAKKNLYISFAQTRMRNGKHENNPPSRFLKEIDPIYLVNPLDESDFETSEDSGFGSFRGFGSRYAYSSSGPARSVRNPSYPGSRSSSGGAGRNSGVSGSSSGARPVSSGPAPYSGSISSKDQIRNRPLPPKIPDEQFTPMPQESIKVGMRVEHNRFGLGTVTEISGSGEKRKAKIVFDNYGEKLLLLRFAKIRLPLL